MATTGIGIGLGTGITAADDPVVASEYEFEDPYPNVDIVQVGESVKRITNQYPLLTLGEDTVPSHVEAADLSVKEQKRSESS